MNPKASVFAGACLQQNYRLRNDKPFLRDPDYWPQTTVLFGLQFILMLILPKIAAHVFPDRKPDTFVLDSVAKLATSSTW
ncbi:MAG: hypothetical protein U0670_17735 [Anaerolineae bacterium]